MSRQPKVARANLLRRVSDRRVEYVLRRLQAEPWLRAGQLAPMVKLGPSQIERLFKKQMGTSIDEYSMELRLQWACHLLKTTFLSIKQICNEVGIPDASNLNHQFKKRFGMTPSAYRNTPHFRLNQ